MTLAGQPLDTIEAQTLSLRNSMGLLRGALGRLIPAFIGVTAVSAIFSGTLGGAITNSGFFRNGMIRLQSAIEDLLEPFAKLIGEAAQWLALKLESPEAEAFFRGLGDAIGAAWQELVGFASAFGDVNTLAREFFRTPPRRNQPAGGGDRQVGDEGLGAGGGGGYTPGSIGGAVGGAVNSVFRYPLDSSAFGAGIAADILDALNRIPLLPDVGTGGLRSWQDLGAWGNSEGVSNEAYYTWLWENSGPQWFFRHFGGFEYPRGLAEIDRDIQSRGGDTTIINNYDTETERMRNTRVIELVEDQHREFRRNGGG